MDSLPQELIDAIIDNLPSSSLGPSSLVAKRWRQKSQQRALDTILFTSEYEVERWHAVVKDLDGISSYVRFVKFHGIASWSKPTLLCSLLKSFSSLATLEVYNGMLPDELLGHISRGELGRGITGLYLWFARCTPLTTVSLILSLPGLKKLVYFPYGIAPEEPPPIHPVAPQREPLDLLELFQDANGVAGALIRSQFTSRNLSLYTVTSGVQHLLKLSSHIVIKLTLRGM